MKFWNRDILHLSLLIIVAALFSLIFGHFLHLLLFICIAFIFRQAMLLNQLEQWLSKGAKNKHAHHTGTWAEIYHQIYRIKKTNKKRKKQLSLIIEQFRKSTAALPDAVVVLSAYDEISWFNHAAQSMLGFKKSDKGQRLPNLIRTPSFISFLNKKDPNTVLSIKSPANDLITLQVKIVNFDRNAYLLVAHDITYLKNIERMRKDFVDNISHELRTPLTVLKGYLETLEDMPEEHSPLVAHAFQQMNLQTNRLQSLVNDLLLLANLETQKIEIQCVEIAPLLQQICHESGAIEQLNNRIELFLDTNTNLLGNEQELRSAFSNLIVNAIKYSPKDSIITVRWYQSENIVILDVIDQGEGIPALEIPKITERFYRVNVQRSSEKRGTGLGLAIVKHVLARHEAQLVINSELGKGSCFQCIFPRKRFC